MKTLGILGSMSPASTATYYHIINQQINAVKGANTTAPIILYSMDFKQIVAHQKAKNWQASG